MNVCAFVQNTDTHARMRRIFSDAGWNCWWARDYATLASLLGGLDQQPDLVVADFPLNDLPSDACCVVLGQNASPHFSVDPNLETDVELIRHLQAAMHLNQLALEFDGKSGSSFSEFSDAGFLCAAVDNIDDVLDELDSDARAAFTAAWQHRATSVLGSIPTIFHEEVGFSCAVPDGQLGTDLAEQLRLAFAQPLDAAGASAYITITSGVCEAVVAPGSKRRLWLAWHALQWAVEEGGNRIESVASDQLHDRIPTALEREEFAIHYQPQWTIDGDRLTGMEALLRWHGLETANLSPSQFIPLAAASGQLGRLGDWAVKRACQQVGNWTELATHPLRLGINVATEQLDKGALQALLIAVRQEAWYDMSSLELELTAKDCALLPESGLLELIELNRLGVQVALDNFGASSASDLPHQLDALFTRIAFTTVKLDRSLVARCTDTTTQELIAEVIDTIHAHGARAVAVGVETDGQRTILARLGCDEAQGFLFAPALPADDMHATVRRNFDED